VPLFLSKKKNTKLQKTHVLASLPGRAGSSRLELASLLYSRLPRVWFC
jgi:hypothetical protein